jgi:hypothetical protein
MAALVGVKASPSSSTATIPIDLLAQDGVPPEQGDTVNFSVDATVKSVDGDNATVSITAVNGEPVDDSSAEESTEDEDQDQGAAAPPGGPPQPGGQAGGSSGAGGRGWPAKGAAIGGIAPVRPVGPISPSTLAMGAALRKKAKGQPLPF